MSLSAVLTARVTAATYTLVDPTSTGTWNNTVGYGIWLADNDPATALPGTSDDVLVRDGETVLFGILTTNVNSINVSAGGTFNITSGNRAGIVNGLTNSGLVQYVGYVPGVADGMSNRNLAVSSGNTQPFTFTNSGTFAVTAGEMMLSATIANTGGLVRVDSGATLDLRGATGITGGAFEVSAATKIYATNVGGVVLLANVVTDNAGYWEWFSNGMNDRARTLTVSGGVFSNSGTFILRQDTSAMNFTRSLLDLNVNNSGTFVNNGVLTIENTAAGSSAGSPNGNIEAQLTVENTAAE
ncbi:MAG: hypothetical protein LBK76_10340, partial [Verrucomicrobiales bacterium]|nr:hypothetical protein [Verrucomicrobiales bacterium]